MMGDDPFYAEEMERAETMKRERDEARDKLARVREWGEEAIRTETLPHGYHKAARRLLAILTGRTAMAEASCPYCRSPVTRRVALEIEDNLENQRGWKARAEAAERQVETITMANAANLVTLARVREWAGAKIRKASGAKFQATAEGDAREILAILDGEDE